MKKYLLFLYFILAALFSFAQEELEVDSLIDKKNKIKFVDYFNLMPKVSRDYTPIDFFDEHIGDIINNIDIVIIDKYATPAYDVYYIDSTVLMDNKRGTKNATLIRKQLLFKEGDTINPQLLADVERNIREQLIFTDAVVRLKKTPNISGVDVIIIAHDNRHWNAIFWGSPTSLRLGAGFYDFGGVAQSLVAYGGGVVNPQDPYDAAISYGVKNMFSSQINFNSQYRRTNLQERYGVTISRDFFAYNTRWAGSLSFENVNNKIEYLKVDNTYNNRFYFFNSWLAHSFPLKKLNEKHPNLRFITSARATYKKNYRIPLDQPFQNFVNQQFYISSFGFANRNWYGYEELYSFREFDYVPRGLNVAALLGYEINQFLGGRFYFGSSMNINKFYPKFGFMQNQVNTGSFLRRNKFEQLTIQNINRYFTKRYELGKLGFRQFLNLNTTLSYKRPFSEFYNIGGTALKGFDSQSLLGTKSFVINLESVFYTPIKWWTSRGNFFFFADFAWVAANDNDFLFNNVLNHGYGFGIRFQNRVLSINYLEISFGIYPNGKLVDERIWGYQIGDFRSNSAIRSNNLYNQGVLNDIY